MRKPEDYKVYHHEEFEPFDSTSSLSIEVLQFLKGKPWDDIALAFVQSLRPSYLRVTTGSTTCDARQWRVTVYVNDSNVIESIEQEVEVGLPDRIEHGEHLETAMKLGIDSPQAKWHEGENDGYLYDGINGVYYKSTPEGLVEYPK